MARLKKKQSCGLTAFSQDGELWRWKAGGKDYSWCRAGQVRRYGDTPSQEVIILWCKSVDVALAYTAGYADCWRGFSALDIVDQSKQGEPGSPS